MHEISVREANSQVSTIWNMAHDGETVVITKNGKAWAHVVPVPRKHRVYGPLPGASKNSIPIDLDSFNALDEEENSLWDKSVVPGTDDDS